LGLGVRVKDLYVFFFFCLFLHPRPGTQNPEPGLFGSGYAGLELEYTTFPCARQLSSTPRHVFAGAVRFYHIYAGL
jgi:hypothetical protein